MDSNTILSIIVPCFNAGIYLDCFIKSLIKQTFKDWRAFIIDDGSTDNSIELIKLHQNKDNRINLIKRKRLPKGSQTCRNIGIELAKDSKYIIFFDADDIVAPYCLEQRIKFMEHNPNLDFAVFPAKMFYNNLFDDYAIFGIKDPLNSDISRLLRRTLPYVVWTNIYKYSSIKKYKHYWDENLLSLQDTDYNIQAIIKNMKYKYADEVPIDYFWRGPSINNISSKIYDKLHIKSHLYLINKICSDKNIHNNNNLNNDLKIFILNFVDIFIQDISFRNDLFSLPYLNKHRLFFLQLKLYSFFNKRGIRYIFPTLYKHINTIRQDAEILRVEKLKHYIEITKNHLKDNDLLLSFK